MSTDRRPPRPHTPPRDTGGRPRTPARDGGGRNAPSRNGGGRPGGSRPAATRRAASPRPAVQPAPARQPPVAPAPTSGAGVGLEHDGVRLQKVLAAAGVDSRRGSEQLISEGRVEVDGRVVTEMGRRIDPETAVVHVDGQRIPTADRGKRLTYVAVNKPRGVVSSMWDDEGRPDLPSLLPIKLARRTRLFHVGRLDAETEGLLLLTDDGELTHRLTHPSFGVDKVYVAEVPGPVAKETIATVRAGVEVEGRTVEVGRFRVVAGNRSRAMVEITLHEGRKHIVRVLLDSVGLPVRRLVRVKFGPVALGDVPPGEHRELSRDEVGALYDLVGL